MHRVAFLVLGLGALGVLAFPTTNELGREAEVIKLTDADAPIVLPPSDDAENVILRDTANNTESLPAPPLPPAASPSPVPENVAVTTEKFEPSTPNLVPAVVDISTPDPNSTPAPATNGTTTTPAPEDEDEESEEDDSEEEAEADEEEDDEDEEDDNEEEEEEDDEDKEEEEDEEEDEEDKKRDAGKKNKKPSSGGKKRVARNAVRDEEIGGSVKVPARKEKPGSVVFGLGDESEEDEPAVAASAPVGVKKNAGNKQAAAQSNGSKLQGVHAIGSTNEDDEAEGGSE